MVLKFFIAISIFFILFPTVAAQTDCSSDSDCQVGDFCEFQKCEGEFGTCVMKPDVNQCELVGETCGCDGVTYPSDCHRKAAGTSRDYAGECIEEITTRICDSQQYCYGSQECVTFPDIGTRCSDADPCSYYECKGKSVCVLRESFYLAEDVPYYPFELSCEGDCESDSDCNTGEFCDFFPCDLGAGTCTTIPELCTAHVSPVCGCDGKTYSNDCIRKSNQISKNYDGSCIDQISSVSCDVDDEYKGTCDFVGDEGTCIYFPGIGKRCAPLDAYEYYSCPVGLNYSLLMTYPFQVRCDKTCTNDLKCGSNEYAEYECLLTKFCDSQDIEYCKNLPCGNEFTGNCYLKKTPCPDYYAPVCGCDGITYRNLCYLQEVDAVRNHWSECEEGVEISDIKCDAINPCPEGQDLECIGFPDLGLRCAKGNPCSYYECPSGTTCAVAESYPPKVICGGSCIGESCGRGISYDIQTGVVSIMVNNQPKSVEVKLQTSGSEGVLEVGQVSAEYSNELKIEENTLVMTTSAGDRKINILPDEAVAVSETPNLEMVKGIELKEELKTPTYSVIGEKPVNILGIFSSSMTIETKVNAETGTVISVSRPWWSFLAW